MSKKIIFLIIVTVCGLLAGAEYYLNPPQIFSASVNYDQVVDQSVFADTSQGLQFDYFDRNDFANAELANVEVSSFRQSATLFQRMIIDENKLGFKAISAVFTLSDQPLVKISEFQPTTRELTTTGIYNDLLSGLTKSIEVNEQDQVEIVADNAFGQNSFYFFNQKENPDLAQLVVRGNGKILAFEYARAKHDQVGELIEVVFSD
jgi:hypothetical protein